MQFLEKLLIELLQLIVLFREKLRRKKVPLPVIAAIRYKIKNKPGCLSIHICIMNIAGVYNPDTE